MKGFSSIVFAKNTGLRYWLTTGLSLIMGTLVAVHLWAMPAYATGIYEMPPTPGSEWVLDEADILSRVTEGQLSSRLEKLAQSSGAEVRFVTIHRLDYGETATSFTNDLFKKWFPTPEAQANQVLLVLDNVTNNSAMQVGEGAKSLLSDDIAESIAQETVQVPLRQGNKYNQALLDASDRLIAVLNGKPDPGPPAEDSTIQVEGTFATPEETSGSNATVLVIGLLVAATVIPMATYYLYKLLQP